MHIGQVYFSYDPYHRMWVSYLSLQYGTVYHRIFIQYEMRMARKECHKMCVGYCRVIYSKEEMPLVTGNIYYKYILCLTHSKAMC